MALRTPRYIVPFHPKRVPHYFTDILVVGGGIAGMSAVLATDSDLSVLVVTKDSWQESNSNYAQGGIAGVVSEEDCFGDHIEDTLMAGGTLCDLEVVRTVVEESPNCIERLLNWGTLFDRSEEGELLLGREGGHQHKRVLHAMGDSTGREIMRAIVEQVKRVKHVDMWRDTFTLDLLVHDGECRGAIVWNKHHGKTYVWAKQTVLCTGGVGQIYRESTNPLVATGDGHAMAYRAGVELRDMEFVQFHPTVLYIAGSSRSLITEAMRGEGAHLIDADGHRFMPDYDEREELAPRDVVAQAIVSQMAKTHRPNVFLTLGHLDAEYVHRRFPGISAVCKKFGIDIAKDRIPVRPGAHYMVGGLTVDLDGRTSLDGLWAAGEVTSSGLHGANRLASNSLLEGLVFGERTGKGASEGARNIPSRFQALPISNDPVAPSDELLDLSDIRNALKSLTWRSAGVERTKVSLVEAADSFDHWCEYVLDRQFENPEGWELQNMLVVARLVVQAALQREESRGVHYRSDFRELDDENWRRHQTFRLQSPVGASIEG